MLEGKQQHTTSHILPSGLTAIGGVVEVIVKTLMTGLVSTYKWRTFGKAGGGGEVGSSHTHTHTNL